MSATVDSVTTRFVLDPPVDVPRAYGKGMYRIHYVERQVWVNTPESPHWSVQGVPLTTKGTPAGTLSWRPIDPEHMAELTALALTAEQET